MVNTSLPLSTRICKYFGITTFLFLIPLTTYSASSSMNQWSGAVVYASGNKVSSGVPVSTCHIVSNEHAVRGQQRVSVSIAGKRYQADVISVDSVSDLSLLKLATCPIQNYARVSKVRPMKGDKVTSIYYKSGAFFNRIIRTTGSFLGYLDVVTKEDKNMSHSMLIDDSKPRKGASGGGVATKHGLVSVIFGVANRNNKLQTFAVDYFSLTDFLGRNNIQR